MKNKSNEHKITLQDIEIAIKKIESQQKRKMNASICDIAEMERQQKLLIQYISQKITETKNHNIFNVFDNEASFGKTRICLNALPYFIKNNLNSRVLWVGEETSEIDSHVAYLNDLFQKEVAIAIHSKNGKSKEPIKTLEQYTFVFITHERYRRLSLNAKERALYTNNRDLLIIDEYVDMTKEYITFDSHTYATLKQDLIEVCGAKSGVVEDFDYITERLQFYLKRYKKQQLIKIKTDISLIEKKIDKIKGTMDFCEFTKPKNQVETKRLQDTKKRQQIALDKIKELTNFYKRICTN